MLDFAGIFPIDTQHQISTYTDLRFKDKSKYVCAEALCLYEQRFISVEEIIELCKKAYAITGKIYDIQVPIVSYVPDNIKMQFKDTGGIPTSYSASEHKVMVSIIPEIEYNPIIVPGFEIETQIVPIFSYFTVYTRYYGMHPDLQEIPAKTLFDSIVDEAINIGASDITISNVKDRAVAYFNVRKKKVFSNRILTANNMEDIVQILCFQSPITASNRAKYVGVDLNSEYRGRACINRKLKGYEITIRLLPNAAFDKVLEDCNLATQTVNFIRTYMMNREHGLRVIAGAPMSGKNTTALAMLNEIINKQSRKVVSVEMPVEQSLDGIEQINCDTMEEYKSNIQSLIRQNPDFIYLTEMSDETSLDIMHIGNIGKSVLTTLHANSVSDVIGRIQDMTNLSYEKIIQALHSITYQELLRDEETDTVYPVNRYIYLSQERKNLLVGKSYGEIISMLRSWEGGIVW